MWSYHRRESWSAFLRKAQVTRMTAGRSEGVNVVPSRVGRSNVVTFSWLRSTTRWEWNRG